MAMRPTPVVLLTNGVMTGTTVLNSAAQQLVNIFAYSIQGIITGSAAGTIKLQASNDQAFAPSVPTNWTDITGSSQSVSGAGTVMWNVLSNPSYAWVRVVYTNATGTGTLTLNFFGKGF